MTNPQWYGKEASDEELKRVFRSDQEEEMPLLEERIKVLREVGGVLCDVSQSFQTFPIPRLTRRE